MYTSKQNHFKFLYSRTVLFICDVSCLCRQKHCMLFIGLLFLRKDFVYRKFPKAEDIWNIS